MKNVGTIDSVLRIIVAMVLLIMAAGGYYTPWTWLGLVVLGTALLGYCPLYSVIGLKTVEKS